MVFSFISVISSLMGNLILREETNNIGRIVTPHLVTQPKGNFPHSYVSYTEIYDNNQQQSTQHKIHCGFTAYVFVPQVVILTHTTNQKLFMYGRSFMCTNTLTLMCTYYTQDEHLLGCMIVAVWDSCSVRRFHPSSRSTHCLNSPNCSCSPSFLHGGNLWLFSKKSDAHKMGTTN